MILFCEECGTRNDIDPSQMADNCCQFECRQCRETLVVSVSESQGKQVQAAMQPDESADASPLGVLIVDDSKLIRKVLRQIIEADASKKVVGEAEDGKQALDVLMDKKPDVITLDINMPVMDGLTALKHIMIRRPTPTVMISALTKEGALETFDALKYGAIDFLPKPSQVKGADLNAQRQNILRKLELAAAVQIESVRYLRRPSQDKVSKCHSPAPCRFVLAIGATDGGYGALLNMVPGLRGDLPAAYVAVLRQAPQHIEAFVRYLDLCSQLEVRRAVDGMPLNAGICYLAAMDEYVCFEKKGEETFMKIEAVGSRDQGSAANLMMKSASAVMQGRAAGVILSGTGMDGVEGLAEIISSGGAAFVQNPANCLFKETPLAAIEANTIEYLVSDKQMAGAINAFLNSHSV